MNIEFINAKRTGKHSVEATYALDGTPFTVEWCNIHPGTGEVCDYDLDLRVKCADEALAERIENAISAGETDDNADIDIYLFVRDEFDRCDAESLCAYTLTATDWTIEKHGQTVIVKDDFDNTYEVFLQLPRTPDSQQTIDAIAVYFDDDFQEAVYEKAKEHLYGLFDDADTARASFALGKIVDRLTDTTVDEIKHLVDCTDAEEIERLITANEMVTARIDDEIYDEIYFLVIGQYSNFYNVRYFEEADFTDLD